MRGKITSEAGKKQLKIPRQQFINTGKYKLHPYQKEKNVVIQY